MSVIAARKLAEVPGEVALRDEIDALTWTELDRIANRATNALLTFDLGADRRVAVFAENSVTTVVAYLAVALAGGSGVPVNYHLLPAECSYILRDADVRLLFVGPENLDRGVVAAAEAGGIPVIAWGVESQAGILTWDEFLARGSDEEPPSDMRPLPYLHYTSGTTGFPKGTETPPDQYPGCDLPTIREHVEAMSAWGWRRVFEPGVDPDDYQPRPQITIAPLYHSGQIGAVKALAGGRPIVLHRRFDAEKTLQAIEQYRVERIGMVPTHMTRLMALPDDVRERYDVSSLNFVSLVGAPSPADIKRRFIEWLGPIVLEAYGATEQGVVSTITSEEWLAHPGSVGKVREGLELYVIGESGEELGPNEVGKLYFRDKSGFDVRFHNDDEKTASVHLSPGVWTIGEVGYIDDEGYLFLTDRFSDMIISGGVNIFPAEAEQVIATLPGVVDVGCIGVPHPDLGEVLHALVVPADPDDPPDPEQLLAQTRERLTLYKCPRSIELVTDLGRNPVGKLNKQQLRKRWDAGTLVRLQAEPAGQAADRG